MVNELDERAFSTEVFLPSSYLEWKMQQDFNGPFGFPSWVDWNVIHALSPRVDTALFWGFWHALISTFRPKWNFFSDINLEVSMIFLMAFMDLLDS